MSEKKHFFFKCLKKIENIFFSKKYSFTPNWYNSKLIEKKVRSFFLLRYFVFFFKGKRGEGGGNKRNKFYRFTIWKVKKTKQNCGENKNEFELRFGKISEVVKNFIIKSHDSGSNKVSVEEKHKSFFTITQN
jgi:hypothetical protein